MGDVEPRWTGRPPLRQLSALAVRRGAELVAIGDDDFDVVTAELGPDSRPARARRHAVVAGGAGERSDFEGLAVDGAGRVLILQEGASRVLVLDPDLGAVRQTISLVVRPEDGPFARDWTSREPESRGEALALLRDGRLLVAKQRDPVALVELGPSGAVARGFGPGRLATEDEPFALLSGDAVDYVVLRAWTLHDDAARVLPSINDLALDSRGCLHAISSLSRRIARLEGDVSAPGDRVEVRDEWRLPDGVASGRDERAEALTLIADNLALVGVDSEGRDNLVALALG